MLHCVNRNQKWGYIDSSGELVVPIEAEACLPFAEGVGGVFNGNRLDIISTDGQVVGTCDGLFIDHLSDGFSEGLLCVYHDNNRLAGYIDAQGQWVIPPRFLNGSRFRKGVAVTTRETSALRGLIKTTGDWVVEPKYDDILEFGKGMHTTIASPTNDTFQLILMDTLGGRVGDHSFEDGHQGCDGLHPVASENGWGVVDENCGIVVPFVFDEISSFSNGLAAARCEGKGIGVIDKTGHWQIEPKFHWIGRFSEGSCPASVISKSGEEKWGYLNIEGCWVIDPFYDEAFEFQNGIAQVSHNSIADQFQYINRSGDVVWEP